MRESYKLTGEGGYEVGEDKMRESYKLTGEGGMRWGRTG